MQENLTFDYIVVGSGPAGSVMARRLSDDGRYTVLLLEAGDNHDGDELIRSATSNLYDHFPEYFWPGQSAPQPHVNGKNFAVTGGRLAGGGSSVNGEMYVRPTPYVLRKWAEAGGPQWAPEQVAKRYEKLEHYNGREVDGIARGKEGKLNIREAFPQDEVPALTDKFITALSEATERPVVED